MDDVVKIYQPFTHLKHMKKPEIEYKKGSPIMLVSDKKRPKWKFFFDIKVWKEVFRDRQKKERELMAKYPAFNVFYNWLIVLLVVGLFVSFVIWGMDIRTDRIAEAFAVAALADYKAEQNAAAKAEADRIAAEKASEEAVIHREAVEGAKMLYGIRLFFDKYGYSDRDARTYIRCACNRVDYSNGEMTFEDVVRQEEQFLGYSEKNQVLEEYYNMAKEELTNWHHETAKPWDVSYRFAELNPDGIWLVQEFNSNGYARRVRY